MGLIAFAAFSSMASAVYVTNDLLDLEADRRHSRKRKRPFASGALSIPTGLILAAVLTITGLAIALQAGIVFLLLVYGATSLAYSIRLKEIALLDVFCLAFLYTIRLYGGGVAVGHHVSTWLLAFSMFLFLGLAFVKRVGELHPESHANSTPEPSRRGYQSEDLGILSIMGVASAFIATLVLALFIQSEAALEQYKSPGLIWFIVPIMGFWQCRMWLATSRGTMHDDPILFTVKDRVSWACIVLALLLLLTARYAAIPAF
jgi:4-hydroxybenzoate polyprenyltransferase